MNKSKNRQYTTEEAKNILRRYGARTFSTSIVEPEGFFLYEHDGKDYRDITDKETTRQHDEIMRTPSYINELKEYQLERLLTYSVGRLIHLRKIVHYLQQKEEYQGIQQDELHHGLLIEGERALQTLIRDLLKDESGIEHLAITMTSKQMEQTNLCERTLKKYVKIDKQSPGRANRDIFVKEFDRDGKSNVAEQTFYYWVKKYKNNLEALRGEQQK